MCKISMSTRNRMSENNAKFNFRQACTHEPQPTGAHLGSQPNVFEKKVSLAIIWPLELIVGICGIITGCTLTFGAWAFALLLHLKKNFRLGRL